MRTLKKKDIKNYKKVDVINDEVEELDELVGALGGPISGDEKEVNNSEIKTAPQQTSDDYEDSAIQANRYLFNVNTTGGKSNAVNAGYVVAKEKMVNLLENLMNEFDDNNEEPAIDVNSNNIPDINELPSNVASKLNVIVNTIEKNNLNSSQILILINHMLTKISNKIEPKDRELIKNKL